MTSPSNASYKTYTDNTQSSFKIRTAKVIDLSRDAVALTEIQYPKSWLDVTDAAFEVYHPNADKQMVRLLEGRYASIKQLVDAFQKLIENLRLTSAIMCTGIKSA